jgi:hypothetical protein
MVIKNQQSEPIYQVFVGETPRIVKTLETRAVMKIHIAGFVPPPGN